LVPKTGNVADVLAALQRKAGFPEEMIPKIRVYEAHGSKVYRECQPGYAVANFTDYIGLYAEPKPDEDTMEPDSEDYLATAFHFDKEVNKPHGHPFIFRVRKVSKSGFADDFRSLGSHILV
jgi:ubiquitin carboxyl-terminal hydrolase 7